MPLSQAALFAALPAPFQPVYDGEAPWSLLGEPLAAALAALPSEAIRIHLPPDVHLAGDRIAIGAGTRIHPGAVVEGPIHIGEGVEVGPGAYLHGGNWIDDGCAVGASTEVKGSILCSGARVGRLVFVEDSILGRAVELGAGTLLVGRLQDGAEVRVPVNRKSLLTGRRRLGAVLGDDVQAGANCVLDPGVVVGAGSRIDPGVRLVTGIYPGASAIKLRQQLDVVPIAPAD